MTIFKGNYSSINQNKIDKYFWKENWPKQIDYQLIITRFMFEIRSNSFKNLNPKNLWLRNMNKVWLLETDAKGSHVYWWHYSSPLEWCNLSHVTNRRPDLHVNQMGACGVCNWLTREKIIQDESFWSWGQSHEHSSLNHIMNTGCCKWSHIL